MARAGMYKSEKRKKELMRLKKREEKRQKRLRKGSASEGSEELSVGGEGEQAGAGDETGEITGEKED